MRGRLDTEAYTRAVDAARVATAARLEIFDPAASSRAVNDAYGYIVAFCLGMGAAFLIAWSMS